MFFCQVQSLAIRLEKENGAFRCSTNAPCSVPRDKLEQIDCKCLEEIYSRTSLNSSEKSKVNRNKIYKMNKIDCAVTSIKELKERFVK